LDLKAQLAHKDPSALPDLKGLKEILGRKG
jgi:hypothetical protein